MTTQEKSLRVFITGASSGLGKALAQVYASQGATLGLLGRKEDALQALAQELPGQHKTYVVDVADREALHAAAYDFQTLGPTDIVIACAGISVGTVTEYLEDFETFRRVYETNVFGLVATFEPFIANMKKAKKGTLVGISSVAGVRGLPGASAYCSSKSAVRTYCESLRVDLYNTGVKVVTIAPGFIDTPMTKVDPYKMPFLMPVNDFAQVAVSTIEKGCSYKVIPWQMGVVGKLLRLVPNPVYDYFVSKRGRKPRQHEMPK
ncbi:short-chain dehydrogenase [Pelistega indica]|uniref:Short-chain dehydrogenase n=1 Tax=Pelistega indica TaxID=1414851 RepID=V8FUC8_9BURK|nr:MULTISPECIES: SDR family oxidoreductase [Pelistega]ETD67328.1 short-chain dehydrogenase [Pelistega indica]